MMNALRNNDLNASRNRSIKLYVFQVRKEKSTQFIFQGFIKALETILKAQ